MSKEREALKAALEALERGETELRWKAITAIKEALAQPEYQSTADKSKLEKTPAKGTLLAQTEQCPHGVDDGACKECYSAQTEQEPVATSDTSQERVDETVKQRHEQELSGLQMVISGAIYDFAGYLTTRDKVIKVGSTANASPVADLVKEWAELRGLSLDDAAVLSWQDWLANVPASDTSQERVDETVKQRHEQEPVAYSYTSRITGAQGFSHHPMPRFINSDSWDIKPLYTTPPQRTWVGLTQKDIDIAFDDTQEGGGFNEFARAIEAKLKEKNT